jgi:hypothetical protein
MDGLSEPAEFIKKTGTTMPKDPAQLVSYHVDQLSKKWELSPSTADHTAPFIKDLAQRHGVEAVTPDLKPHFQLAQDYTDFSRSLYTHGVALQSVQLEGDQVHCIVRAVTKAEHQGEPCSKPKVGVRITDDNWQSYHDLAGILIDAHPPSSSCYYINFKIYSPSVSFCVWSESKDKHRCWDNNFGRNFSISRDAGEYFTNVEDGIGSSPIDRKGTALPA